jgi:soluble lytic murein transglycosylase-like protein
MRSVIRSAPACAGIVLVVLFCQAAAVNAAPANPEVLIQAGIRAYRAGVPAQALQSFVEAAQRAPHDAVPALWAGVAAAGAGNWSNARAFLEEALRRPHSPAVGRLAEAWLARLEVFAKPVAAPSGGTALKIGWLALASNPRLSWGQARWLGAAVDTAARHEGLDPWLLAAVIYIESRFNHQSVSWAGAMGLGQLMPDTARAAGVDPRDPWGNVLGSAEILRWNYLEFRDWPLALAAYNAGSDAVKKYGGIPPYAETQWYVRAVLWVYSQVRRPA